ncbi:MAG: hypothetical protein ACI8XI_000617 [Woeseiaceae bacterium]|jgi:hypothetical protein|tara:strand:+ start:2102 stop:2788 length:687 start_codon:yes stop_codon:yes gene_type:complete
MNYRYTKYKTILLLFALTVNGCSSPLLNSEMIEKKFGSYDLDIIENNDENRISFLFSNETFYISPSDKNAVKNHPIYKKKYHTLALVNFVDSKKIPNIHQEIAKGGSIGATFKKYGWNITKDNLFIFELDKHVHTITKKWLNKPNLESLPIHVYNLSAKKEAKVILYAEIIEIHHPDYLSMNELKEIYETNHLPKNNKVMLQTRNLIIDRLSKKENNQIIMDLLDAQY